MGVQIGKEIALRPNCSTCGEFLQLRKNPTPEQAWCGIWYDHPPTACPNRMTFLYESTALKQQNQALRDADDASRSPVHLW